MVHVYMRVSEGLEWVCVYAMGDNSVPTLITGETSRLRVLGLKHVLRQAKNKQTSASKRLQKTNKMS